MIFEATDLHYLLLNLPNLINIKEHGYLLKNQLLYREILLLQKFNDGTFSAFDIMEAGRFHDSKNRYLEF